MAPSLKPWLPTAGEQSEHDRLLHGLPGPRRLRHSGWPGHVRRQNTGRSALAIRAVRQSFGALPPTSVRHSGWPGHVRRQNTGRSALAIRAVRQSFRSERSDSRLMTPSMTGDQGTPCSKRRARRDGPPESVVLSQPFELGLPRGTASWAQAAPLSPTAPMTATTVAARASERRVMSTRLLIKSGP
jgi:hypothetical protein